MSEKNKIELCPLDMCTSCLACVQVCAKHCISMMEDGRGFRFPVIDRNVCVECGACMKACHQLQNNTEKHSPLNVYAAWHKDRNIHASSSSGGAFTAIAETILDQLGVVFGASTCRDGRVRHICVDNKADLVQLRGSKYVQSNISDSYSKVKKYLKDGRKVLFVGTPCQVCGLYSFLHRDYENLCTCDFVCHGVPSQKVLDMYLRKLGAEPTDSVVSFRDDRVCGFRLQVDGTHVSALNDYYMRAFNKGLMFMDACYTCKYATPERVSDFTIGDFWGIGIEKPFLHHHPLGISLILVNTQKAQGLLEEFRKRINLEERELSEAVKGNHNLSKASLAVCDRADFYKDFERLNKWQLMKKYGLFPSARDFIRPIKRVYKIYKTK